MKKGIILIIITIAYYSLYSCASTGSGTDGLSLMDAIEQSAECIADELPAGSRVAIVAFESESDNLSNFIMEELTGALFDRKIEVADRQNLEYVYRELNFQMSGDVSDESAQSIGKFLGAQLVITGQLRNLGSTYRFMVNAIYVEKATPASIPRFTIRNDKDMQSMIIALNNQSTTAISSRQSVTEPQTAGAFFDRGLMYGNLCDYNKALEDFTTAIRLNPNFVEAYYRRAIIYQKTGNTSQAITELETAMRINPSSEIKDMLEGIKAADEMLKDYYQNILEDMF
jgi:tetratricopeptide (TPR) repeat protein